MSARALIFYMRIPCDKTFPLVTLTLEFDPFLFKLEPCLKLLNCECRALLYHMSNSSDNTGIKIFVLVTFAIFGIGHYQGYLCFTNTSCLPVVQMLNAPPPTFLMNFNRCCKQFHPISLFDGIFENMFL